MRSTRRTLLRRGLACSLAGLAGCAGTDAGTRRQSTVTSERRSRTTRGTPRTTSPRDATDEASTADPTTSADEAPDRAVTFGHRTRMFDRSVRDADGRHLARVLRDEDETRPLDAATAREDRSERDPTRVERFVSETDFEEAALLVVQSAVPSPRYELEFHPAGRTETNQVLARIVEGDSKGSEPAISTGLMRVPTSKVDAVSITIADVAGAYGSDSVRSVETLSPPDETVFESVDVGPYSISENVGAPSGALVTSADAADRFVGEDRSFSEFVRKTNFEASAVVAVEATMPTNGHVMFPESAEVDGNALDVTIRQQDFGGGLNAGFDHLLLTRVPGSSAPTDGTATVRRYGVDGTVRDERDVALTADPGEWSEGRDSA